MGWGSRRALSWAVTVVTFVDGAGAPGSAFSEVPQAVPAAAINARTTRTLRRIGLTH
ncbi:hypothetical protein AB5J56_28515 [Streptomyces sp. R21]|uniref:Uncharacterized protein n=1 Tax=Streptomyces sp. R21 TaxID=3238627 RepID=A0AB39PE46_9ACTN